MHYLPLAGKPGRTLAWQWWEWFARYLGMPDLNRDGDCCISLAWLLSCQCDVPLLVKIWSVGYEWVHQAPVQKNKMEGRKSENAAARSFLPRLPNSLWLPNIYTLLQMVLTWEGGIIKQIRASGALDGVQNSSHLPLFKVWILHEGSSWAKKQITFVLSLRCSLYSAMFHVFWNDTEIYPPTSTSQEHAAINPVFFQGGVAVSSAAHRENRLTRAFSTI